MADITLSSVYPSAKFISTDANGDLQEVVGVQEVASSADIDGLTFTAKTAGVAGNNLSIAIVDSVGSGGIAYTNSGDAHTISLELSASSYTLSALKTDIANNAPATFTDVFEVTYTSTGTSSNTLTNGGQSATNLSGGIDAVNADLDASKDYLLISTDDIADYDGVSEQSDGRKVFYGLLETATSNISNLVDKPDNLTVNRGNIVLLSDTQMRRVYSVSATLDILDTDLSSES